MGLSQCFGGTHAGPSNAAGIQAGQSTAAGTQAGAAGNIPRRIRFRKLKKATNNFSINERIGEGETAHVFRGGLEDDQLVAVKQLKPSGRRNADYEREVEMLTRLSHPNIINLIGFCVHESKRIERIVVYEYMPLRSLHDLLHDRQGGEGVLDWGTRMKIGAGVSKGLSYLHNEAEPPVVFRDLKPADVLLGQGYHPKISDFGAAINVPSRGQSSAENNPYWAPETAIFHKSDVYSFGVLLLEIMTRNNKFPRMVPNQVMVAGNFFGLADPELNGQFKEVEFTKALSLAMLCMQIRPTARPDMKDVVRGMNNLAGEPGAEWPVEFNVAAE